MTEPTTPAGWYDDGSGTGALRYWDGGAWTDHRAPAPAAPTAGPADTTTPIGNETPVASHDTLPYGSPAASATQAPDAAYAAVSPSGTTMTDASAPPPNRKPNVLAIIALAVAAVGFIFACIPGALIVGWVLLPIAFVLSIVALFLKGAKWPAITGLIVSIVGTIVGVVVFFTVVTTSFSTAFDEVDGAIAEASEAAEEATEDGATNEAPAPDAAGTLAFGDTMVYEDNVELTVSAPEPYTPSEFAAGADQATNLVFTLTITNNSDENLDPLAFPQVSSGGQEASQIFDATADGVEIGLPPTNVVLPGQSVMWKSAWSVADPASLTLQVSPGFFYDDAIFTNFR